MSYSKDFTVAICGGGLCGLACAVALSRAGISVTVFEASSFSQEAGAGVGLGPAFLDAVVELLDPSIIQFRKRCTSIDVSENGRHVMHFADSTTHETDLIIGADGVRSVARRFVIGELAKDPLIYPNTAAYRGLVPTEDLRRAGVQTELTGRPLCFVGLDKINIVVFLSDYDKPPQSELPYPWVESVSQKELKEHCKDWGHDPKIILDHLKNPSKWSIHALDPLQNYVRDKVVLVGDADVLARYNDVRPPRANDVLRASARAGRLYDSFRSPEQDKTRLQTELSGIWEDVWSYDLHKDVTTSFETLHRLHVF
ncbi:hypothetical protein HHX47_DHR1001215 [Lentinula edodes]|nr:hypothetical protein HHX47_DHR1001215 [Lentinula edodes]